MNREQFEALTDMLPLDVNWGDTLTPQIALHLVQAARIARLEAELAKARKVPEQYSLSRDYKALFAFICAGNVAAGYVHPEHDKFCDGDVVGITRRGPWQVHVGVRGCSFFSLYQFNSEDGPSEEEQFIKGCEWCGLEWIEPVCAAAPQEPTP